MGKSKDRRPPKNAAPQSAPPQPPARVFATPSVDALTDALVATRVASIVFSPVALRPILTDICLQRGCCVHDVVLFLKAGVGTATQVRGPTLAGPCSVGQLVLAVNTHIEDRARGAGGATSGGSSSSAGGSSSSSGSRAAGVIKAVSAVAANHMQLRGGAFRVRISLNSKRNSWCPPFKLPTTLDVGNRKTSCEHLQMLPTSAKMLPTSA